MHRTLASLAVAAIALVAWTGLALADDWTVTKARGSALQMVDGAWQPLGRGDIVPDTRMLRTAAGARVELVRGTETIELGPGTQVQILDRGGAKPFTTVQEYFGDVAIDADVRNVRHFAVQTPYVAAVVKGTHFEVVTGPASSTVSVQRGQVWVGETASNRALVVVAGQSATAGRGQPLALGNRISLMDNTGPVNAAGAPAAPGAGPGGQSPGDTTTGDTATGLGVDVTLGDTDLLDVGIGGGDGIDIGIADGDGGGLGVSLGGGDGLNLHLGGLQIGL